MNLILKKHSQFNVGYKVNFFISYCIHLNVKQVTSYITWYPMYWADSAGFILHPYL